MLPDPVVTVAATPKEPFYANGAFWITLLLFFPIDWVIYKVMDDLTQPNHDLRLVVVTAVISGALGAVTGFWLASSYSSGKKDDTIASAVKAVNAPEPAAPAVVKVVAAPPGAPAAEEIKL